MLRYEHPLVAGIALRGRTGEGESLVANAVPQEEMGKVKMGYHKTIHGHCVRKNGMTKTYRSWALAKSRCLRPADPRFDYYGGRGIAMCDRWAESFQAFLADMGERPAETTLDRIDNNGNYEPGNCRWATRKEQGRNKRTNRILVYQGEEKTLPEWADIFGFHRELVRKRLGMGWSVEKALTTPLRMDSRHRGGGPDYKTVTIFQLLDVGMTKSAIAHIFGVSIQAISDRIKRWEKTMR